MSGPHAILLSILLVACDVGEVVATGPGDSFAPDAGAGGPDGAVTVACRDAVASVPNGEHNAGQACLDGGCHGPGGEGPRFTLGGTLYAAPAGGTPVVGGTITIRDANGVTLDLPSAQNGNFWTSQTIAFPVTTFASRCPDARSMIGPVADGNCNTSGCHAQTGGAGRVYLP